MYFYPVRFSQNFDTVAGEDTSSSSELLSPEISSHISLMMNQHDHLLQTVFVCYNFREVFN